jgi:hypothetical protein
MTAVVAAGATDPSRLAKIAQKNRFHILQELADCIVQGEIVPEEKLRIAVQVGEGLFYSQDPEDYQRGFEFFRTVLQSGDDEFFQATTPFFLQGRAPCPPYASFRGFDALVKELIAHVHEFRSGRAVAIQTLLKESESKDAFARTLALECFGLLLGHCKRTGGELEVLKAATKAVHSVLNRPSDSASKSMEYRLYGPALLLLDLLIDNHLHQNEEEIVPLVNSLPDKESPYLQTKGAELVQKVASREAAAKRILPSLEAAGIATQLSCENPAAVLENPEYFWSLFVVRARFNLATPLAILERAKEAVEKLRPFFQRESSFFALSRPFGGFLIDASPFEDEIDLTSRPSDRATGTKGDYDTSVFESSVKLLLPQIATVLGYECMMTPFHIRFRIRCGGNSEAKRKELATLICLQKKKALGPK